MNSVLWILQVLLAAEFLMHGWIMTWPPADLVEVMNAAFAPWFRLFIGIAELLAGVGLILPSATRILPWLTPLASAGLMIVSASATVLHVSRGETGSALMTAILLILTTFVAYMRWKVKPIAARSASHAPGGAMPVPPDYQTNPE